MEEGKIFAFVLMPFAREFDDLYKFGIKEPAEALGIVAERVDEQIYSEGILERIYRQIEIADIVIADMSSQNPNVFYEVGYAHGKQKLCILLTSDPSDIPFDLKHKRHVVYANSIATLKKLLADELRWAITEIDNVRKSRIKVVLKNTSGELEKTKYLAYGTVRFVIDLMNESGSASSEIEAAYFYSTSGWILFQDGRECSSTDSDIPDFKRRHFLVLPLRRLQKNSWAQIKFEAKRILASALRGEELKDSYKLTGRSILRLVTSQGNVDYDLSVDVSIDENPF